MIGLQLASQPKVELPHAVVVGVVDSQLCECFTNQAKVLLDQSLLDRLLLRRQKENPEALRENLEEINGVLNVFEVRGNFQPTAEVLPLVPGGGVFLEDGCRETLCDFLLFRMAFSFFLHTVGRGSRREGLLCGKCVRKWERKCRSIR